MYLSGETNNKYDRQVCSGDQPMLSPIVLFWQKPYVCVQQVLGSCATRRWCVPPPLGVMHPSFDEIGVIALFVSLHYGYFWRVCSNRYVVASVLSVVK